MERSKLFNPVRAVILMSLVLVASLFVIADITAAESEKADQTNSNTHRKKKPKKVVKPTMNKVQRRNVSPGNWGGNGIRLVVEANSTAIEYDCAHGEITGVLTIDQNGNFDAKGFHTRERGGPIREGVLDRRDPAHYTGRISGNQMTLKVMMADTGDLIGDFQLELGKNVRLHKCL